MNALRLLSHRSIIITRKAIQKPTQRLLNTHHHRTFKNRSPFYRRQQLFNKNRYKTIILNQSSRKFNAVFGVGVMSTFIKSAGIFFGIPITAMLSTKINTLPFDALYGCVLPYHAYVGMHHILTDYYPAQAWIAYAIAGVIFIGLQNLNFQGEGISPMVRRVFVKEKISTKKEDVQNKLFKK